MIEFALPHLPSRSLLEWAPLRTRMVAAGSSNQISRPLSIRNM